MKKLLSILLVAALVLSVVVMPVSAAPADGSAEPTTGLGRGFKFTFGENGQNYTYERDAKATYKSNEFTPLLGYTGSVATAENKTVTNRADGKQYDVLRVQTDGQISIVPLTTDGTPFETQPGKTYKVNVVAYNVVANNYSQYFLCGNTPNDNHNWANYVIPVVVGNKNVSLQKPNVLVRGVSSGGWGYAAGSDNRSVNAIIDENTVDYSKMIGWPPGANGKVSAEFVIPSNNDQEGFATYNEQTDSYTYTFTKVASKDNATPVVDEETGEPVTLNTNNYFSLNLLGGVYVDKNGTPDDPEDDIKTPFTLDIVSIEIWESDYTPDVEMIVNGKVDNVVAGADRDNINYYIPDAENCPEGKIFTGWYIDEACTESVVPGTALGVTVDKVYAGYKTPLSGDMTFDLSKAYSGSGLAYPTEVFGDTKGEYLSNFSPSGWAYKGCDEIGSHFSASTPWSESGALIMADQQGVPYVAKPNTAYKITIEYKVEDLINAAEVNLPVDREDKDDYSFDSNGWLSLELGIGMDVSARRDLGSKTFIQHTDRVTFREVDTQWQTKEVVLNSGDLNDATVPFIGVWVQASALPRKYNDAGKYDRNQGDDQYGRNSLVVRKLTVEELGSEGDLELYVDGELVKTVALADRDTTPFFIPQVPQGKTFAGWYEDEACTKLINTNNPAKVSKYIRKAYAGYVKKAVAVVMDTTEYMEDYVAYPTETDGVYRGTIGRGGWNYHNNRDGLLRFYSVASWPQGGTTIVCDGNGSPFLAEPNSEYTITVEYTVDNLVKAADVTLPDNREDKDTYEYSDGYVSLWAGVGLPAGTAGPAGNSPVIKANEKQLTFKEISEDWETATFTVVTDDLVDLMPVVGIYTNSSALPKTYDAAGKETSAASSKGDNRWGYNSISIRKVTVTKVGSFAEVNIECNGGYPDKSYQPAKTATQKVGVFALADAVRPGYEFKGWFTDKELTIPAEGTEVCGGETFYAKWEKGVSFEKFAMWTSYNEKGAQGFGNAKDFKYFFNTDRFTIVDDEDAHSGEKSLRYVLNTETADYDADRIDSLGDNVVPLTKVNNGSTYTVKFYAKVNALSGPVTINFATTDSNIWNKNTTTIYYGDQSTVTIAETATTGEWVEYTATFKANVLAPGANNLLMCIKPSVESVPVELYFDDFTFEEESPAFKYGDVDGNMEIDTQDLVQLKKYLAGLVDVSTIKEGADLDANGGVDTQDMVTLKKYLAGLISQDELGPKS